MTLKRMLIHGLGLATLALPASGEEIAEVGVDWVGNDIIVEAVQDPRLPQVTCYVAYFDRSIIDRLQQGNWFEDPSYSAINCVATDVIPQEALAGLPRKEDIFSQRQSLIFKSVKVSRIHDPDRGALIYLSHASELTQGSGKMAISAVVPISR